MLLKKEVCRQCPRFVTGKGFTTTLGKGLGNVLIVGAGPDWLDVSQETASSQYSEGGAILRRALGMASLDIDHFVYANLLWCHSRQSASPEIINYCTQNHLRPLVKQLKPRAIVALGDLVKLHLTGLSGRQTDVRHTRGFLVPGQFPAEGYNVKITFDPQMIREGNMHLLGALAEDLKLSLTQVREPCRYDVKGAQYADAWLREAEANPLQPIAYDIETSYSLKKNDEEEFRQDNGQITQIQFALSDLCALVLPWCVTTKEFTAKVMALPNPKLSWNGNTFDQPRLEREQILFNGRQVDLMPAWHFLEPDLPQNLSMAAGTLLGNILPPWKHTMHENMVGYGALDVVSLHKLHPIIFERLQTEGLMQGYLQFIENLQPVLAAMAARGFPIDLRQRAEFKVWLGQRRQEIDDEIQLLVPDELKDAHPKKGYKREPKGKLIEKRDDGIYRLDPKTGIQHKLIQREFDGELRWCQLKPFLVSSPLQVKRYAKAHGHHIDKTKTASGWKESTNKKVLAKVANKVGDQFYQKLIELRELGKIEETYIDGWPTDENGLVHTQYHFAPASGQIGSREPNVQNLKKTNDPVSKRLRSCVAASPQRVLIELDMTAFHASTLAYCARDAVYGRLAKIDPHSFLAAHLLELPGVDGWFDLDDNDLSERLAWVKKTHEWVRNKQAKPSILGIGFGMGVNKLYRLNDESFKDLAQAKKVHSILKALFPRIFEWQDEIRIEAQTSKRLITPFGCVRRFYDVFDYDTVSGQWRPGSQSEECIAFPPSNIAHCHIKQAMLRIREKGWDAKYGLCNMIHDSFVFNCPISLADECIHNVRQEMERKSTVLIDPVMAPDGFWVAAEASIGPNWNDMRKVG